MSILSQLKNLDVAIFFFFLEKALKTQILPFFTLSHHLSSFWPTFSIPTLNFKKERSLDKDAKNFATKLIIHFRMLILHRAISGRTCMWVQLCQCRISSKKKQIKMSNLTFFMWIIFHTHAKFAPMATISLTFAAYCRKYIYIYI